jgi:hypothetical protein
MRGREGGGVASCGRVPFHALIGWFALSQGAINEALATRDKAALG